MIKLMIKIIRTVTNFIDALYNYRGVYALAGLIATRKFKRAENKHKYAILVAARNEETVIGNLIESIKLQDYDKELVTVFVVADNCSDKTADIAREMGAVCYERFDNEHRTKGYALQYLVERIKEDYGIENYEGYFVFDADNLLKQDYISRMNDSFDAGAKIVTSYRNTKNFGENWISASYAVHWLRTIRTEHRARSLFHLATRIQGTGFLFANEIIKNGWNYTSLTEDRAFCADATSAGYEISYNNEAEFFDEQPVSIDIAMRQRIRWAKGHLQALFETGGRLFCNIFKGPAKTNGEKGILYNIKFRFMNFDMLTVVFPKALLSLFKKISVFLLRVALIFSAGSVFGTNLCPDLFRYIFNFFGLTKEKAVNSFSAVVLLLLFTFSWTVYNYLNGILMAVYVYIIERRRIPYIKWYKKVWFCITFPIFDLIGKLALVIAIFKKVEWKPIPHCSDVKINEISGI